MRPGVDQPVPVESAPVQMAVLIVRLRFHCEGRNRAPDPRTASATVAPNRTACLERTRVVFARLAAHHAQATNAEGTSARAPTGFMDEPPPERHSGFGWFVAGLVSHALLLSLATVAGKPGAA